MRFHIDCPLKQVRDVEWMAFEHPQNDALTIDARSDALYFSEDGHHFKATLPHGSYTETSLPKALQSAMACATGTVPVNASTGKTYTYKDKVIRPRNQYTVRVLQDSGRVSISSRHDQQTIPFAIHTFQGSLKVRSFRWINLTEAQLTVHVDTAILPIARGNIVDIVRPRMQPLRVQVVHTVYSTILVRVVGTADRGDVVVNVQGWTVFPSDDTGTLLPELLGLGDRDLWSEEPLTILQSSNPLVETVPMDRKPMHLAVASPHGCIQGDVVTLDGFEGSGGGFMNGQRAQVTQVVSEQQMIVHVDASILGKFLPLHRPLHCMLTLLRYQASSCITIPVGDVLRVEAHDTTVTVTFERIGEDTDNDEDWVSVRLLGPVPWRGWLQKDNVFLKRGVSEVALRYFPFQHAITSHTSLQRNGVVGSRKMNLLHTRAVLLMRLRLGRTEACGIVALKKNNLHIFGRAQMSQPHLTMSGSNHALVGKAYFNPPLGKVPYVDVCFLTPEGSVVHPNTLGDFSLLLRCITSCKHET